MKRKIAMLAMLSIFTASAVSCTSDVNIATQPQENVSASATTAVGETTAANAETTQADAAAVQNNTEAQAAPSEKTENTPTPVPQNNNTAGLKDEGQTNPVINPEFYLFGGHVATQKDDLNMRKEPNTNSEVLDKIPNGTQLDIYSCDVNGWYQVIFNNKKGFVSAEYIKEIEDYDGGASPVPQANQYGFYPVINPPASSISVASLSGTWKSAGDIPETLEIFNGSDIYSGSFTWTGSDGYTFSGYINLEYTEDHGNQQFFYTFYDNSGALWYAFGATGEVPLNDIYAGQSGDPHFIRS